MPNFSPTPQKKALFAVGNFLLPIGSKQLNQPNRWVTQLLTQCQKSTLSPSEDGFGLGVGLVGYVFQTYRDIYTRLYSLYTFYKKNPTTQPLPTNNALTTKDGIGYQPNPTQSTQHTKKGAVNELIITAK